MYMKVFPHGQGDGDQPTRYLVRPDYPGRKEVPPEILRGDPDVTRDLIDSIDRKWKFTAGVLSWHPDDTVTPEQEKRVMDDFESVAFAGLEPDQRNILWVRHNHAGHHELHFVIPRLDLASGKDFNACPPGWQKDFDVFRDLYNHQEGWARPDDPARARLHTPDHADLHNARLIRWGKNPGKDDRAEAKEAIHAYLAAKLEQGLVRSREDVVSALREAGLEINRAGKDYLTVKNPEGGGKLRLKGGIYGEQWNFAEFTGRTAQSQDGERSSGDRKPDPETVRQLEQELGRILARRAQCNRKRYPQQYLRFGERDRLALPDYESGLRQEMFASRDPDFHHSAGGGSERLGFDFPVSLSGNELTPGNRGNSKPKRCSGSAERQDMGHIQGLGSISSRRQGLSADARRLDNHPSRNAWQTGCLDNSEEISHDRIGKNAQRHTDPHGTGNVRHADGPRQDTGRAAASISVTTGGTGMATGPDSAAEQRFAGIDAAIARCKRCVQELGTIVAAFAKHFERQSAVERDCDRSRGMRMRM
jgi:hypothetical protein